MDSLDNIMLYGSRNIGLADNIMQLLVWYQLIAWTK